MIIYTTGQLRPRAGWVDEANVGVRRQVEVRMPVGMLVDHYAIPARRNLENVAAELSISRERFIADLSYCARLKAPRDPGSLL